MPAEIKTVNVGSILKEQGKIIVDALGKALPRTADASGELRESIKFTIRPFGLTYTFQLKMADYYEWVDKGRKPGKQPPVDDIIKWIADKRFVMKKGQLARKTANSKLQKVSDNFSLSRKLGWAIARSIAKKGTKATHFYTPTVESWIDNLKKELAQALKRDILVEIKTI